jgi:chemotaxis protein CheD
MTEDKTTLLPSAHLRPGEMFMLEIPLLVSTVLGSCIAVTLFNETLGMAAICHALLPHCKKHVYRGSVHDLLDENCIKCPEAYKYVDCALVMMIEAFRRAGIRPEETTVQIFGGAKMIGEQQGRRLNLSVGSQNVRAAEKVLTDHHLKITVSDTGGLTGRKVVFNSQTGKTSVNKIRRLAFDSTARQWTTQKEV